MDLRTRYAALVLVFLLSLGAVSFFHYFPVGVIGDLASIPAIGALFSALFLLARDSIAFDRSVRLEEAKNRFTVGAMSHMAGVAFDKNVGFCEEYATEVHRALEFLFRRGPHVDVLQNANALMDIRKKWAVWLNAEIETQLEKFEGALRKIGANAHLLDELRADEDRTEAIKEAYGTFAAVMGWETWRGSLVTRDLAAERTINGLRSVLGTGELIRLRTELVSHALDRQQGILGESRGDDMEQKRPLLIGVGWGLGTAAGLAVLVGGFLWYQSRPKPPKPWNTAPIKARYDYADTEGDKNTVVVYYTLENTTAFDYRIENDRNVELNAKRQQQNNLSPLGERGRIDYPVNVPAKKRVEFLIHINYECPVKTKANPAQAQEIDKHREEVEKFMVSEWDNLDGFDLLDETNRYEIVFPAGWKHSAKEAGSH